MDWNSDRYEGWHGSGYGYQPQMRVRFGPALSPIIRTLIIINSIVFITDLFTRKWGFLNILVYEPYLAIRHLYLWQFLTYMFMHKDIVHILFNMFFLWMFGSDVERRIGGKNFLTIYLLCGIFGAGFYTLSHISAIKLGYSAGLVGASGAVSGILVAFAMLFPERIILVALLFAIPAKYFVLGCFIIEILLELTSPGGRIARLAHLGGMVFAYFYMKFKFRLSLPFAFTENAGRWFKQHLFRSRITPNRSKYKPIDSKTFIDEQIDPILDKISKHGINSLTWRERRILKKAHSKMK